MKVHFLFERVRFTVEDLMKSTQMKGQLHVHCTRLHIKALDFLQMTQHVHVHCTCGYTVVIPLNREHLYKHQLNLNLETLGYTINILLVHF